MRCDVFSSPLYGDDEEEEEWSAKPVDWTGATLYRVRTERIGVGHEWTGGEVFGAENDIFLWRDGSG